MIRRLSLIAAACLLAATPPVVAQAAGPAYQPQDALERGLWMQVDEYERDLKNSKLVVRDSALNGYLHDVLCREVGPRCSEARIYLVRNPYFNASMAPNGMMLVWSGLLLRMNNEAELAAVLGHEFAHYDKRHTLQLFRDIRKKTDAMVWASFLPFGQLASLGLIGSIYSFNRDMERQSDMASLTYLDAGGYDPAAASRIWHRLRAEMDATAAARRHKSRKDKNGGFFATHPNSKERMETLAAAATRDHAGGAHDLGRDRYRAALADWYVPLVDDQVKMADFGGTEFLIAQRAEAGWTPELFYAKGENHRLRGAAGDHDAAIAAYRQGIAAGGTMPELWRGLGLALIKSGARDEGRAMLRDYVARSPDADDRAMMAMMGGVS